MDSKLIVIAIGGNSLIEDAKHVSVKSQYEAARKTAEHIAKLVKDGHRVVIAHGNGPQVGYILLRAEHSSDILHSVPLDSCVADTQGAIGYQLQMALDNEFEKAGLKNKVATIVTQVEVDTDDPSFNNPTKPIGSFMSEEVAKERMEKNGWSCKEDSGRGWRRVVASPKPKAIVEIDTVKILGDNGITVIAAGGGGIPVVRNEDGSLSGREAVIDKDLAAALMAKQLGADLFVISTAVEKVCLNFGQPNQKTLNTISTEEAKQYMSEGHFAPGSMLPKVQAIVDFVESTSNMGLITDPANLYDALHGDKGTKIIKK
jgi:carbamate kinase